MSGQEPLDTAAEEHVLGAMLLSLKAVDECAEVIGPLGAAFYRSSHQLIYRAILAIASERQPDALTVSGFLAKHGKLEEAGGNAKLAELAALVPSTSNAAHYAKIVVETARLRDLLRFADEVKQSVVHRTGENANDLFDLTERKISELRDRHGEVKGKVVNGFQMAEYLNDRISNPLDVKIGVKPPWARLPLLQKGRLYTLAGYPADGKTVQGVHFAHQGSLAGHRVGFVSAEMTWEDIAVRLASNVGGNAKRLETGHMLQQDEESKAAIGKLAVSRIEVLETASPTVGQINRFQRVGKYELLIIDHLHQFQLDTKFERTALDQLMREIAALAKTHSVPILLLAQLSRTGDPKNPFPRPSMAAIRGSAMIEALSWCVWFIWRHRDKTHLPTKDAEFIVAKNRSGPTHFFNLEFHAKQVRFAPSEAPTTEGT